jgi:phage major head subunit gpT-like protein
MYNSAIAVLKGIKGEFGRQLRAAPESTVKAFTEFVTSNSDKEDYIFFDAMPGIKQWIDEIYEGDIKDFKYEIRNKEWAFSILVDRYTLADSRASLGGGLEQQIRSAMREWTAFPDLQIADLLTENGTAFDGTAFFANSRPNIEGTNAIDNLYSGTSGGPYTTAQVEADLKGAKEDLMGFRDRNNKPFNRGAKLVAYVPTHLVDHFETLRNSRQIYISGTKDNVLYQTFDIIVNYDQDTTSDDWYLFNVNAPVQAFIFQTREQPTWKVKDEEDKRNIKYFSVSRSAAGYGNPMACIKIDN